MRNQSETQPKKANPYSPPASVPLDGEKPIDPNDGRWNFATPGRSWILMGGVGLATLVYFVFTVILLDSTGTDRKAGKLFLANTLVLFYWLYTTIAPTKTIFVAGCTSVGVQVIITGLMLYREIGDVEIVLVINLVIIAALLVLTMLCRQHQRHARKFGVL